jgi:hypothetical protein
MVQGIKAICDVVAGLVPAISFRAGAVMTLLAQPP